MEAVSTHNLKFAYADKVVLNDIEIGFPLHQFSVLLGANGSGKSTLFNLIAGVLKGYSGEIFLNGKEISTIKTKEKAMQIGFLPQFYHTVFPYTVQEILLTGRAAFSGFSPVKADKIKVDEVLNELEIEHLKGKIFSQLSGGEQQMVMVGRVLMQNPEIIVLDEPTNHLDVYFQQFLMDKMKRYSKNGYTVIAIMHNPTLAYQYADKVYFMTDKKVVYGANNIDLLSTVYNTNFINFEHKNLKIVLPLGRD